MEFRGHDHVVECAIFVPVNAYPYVRELINDTVSAAFIPTLRNAGFGTTTVALSPH
jgi:hypothetical protein